MEGMMRQNDTVYVCDKLCSSSRHISKVQHNKMNILSSHDSETTYSKCCSSSWRGKHGILSRLYCKLFGADLIGIIIYAVRGHGSVVSDRGETRQDLVTGDFALIPAFAEHRGISGEDEEVFWVIVCSGGMPIVKSLSG